ncbi:MAG: patatin-like phospholipase/acyl hydrolase [Crocinitomicaceae bacterium]|jgi:patatin-like phospholipase/acyl hydrolase
MITRITTRNEKLMKKVRILSLDGGGIRGIIPAKIVSYIEKEIQRETKNENARIADYFDMVVGTSTGGLLGCFYLTPNPNQNGDKTLPNTKFAADEALAFYTEKGVEIFNDSKYFSWFGLRQLFKAVKYNPKAMERILQEQFGEDMLHDLVKPCTLTTYNLDDKKAFFLRSEDHNVSNRTFKVKDAMRSTSAAPTYFPPAKIRNHAEKLNKGESEFMHNIDGGVFANNPTLVAYSEARNNKFGLPDDKFPTAKDLLIVSIGTGGGNFALSNVSQSAKWGILKWAVSTPNIMMDGSIDTVDYQMKQLYSTLEKEHVANYLRIDVPLSKKIRNYDPDMANADAENCAKLIVAAEKTLASVKPELDEMIKRIIKGE